MWALSWEKRYKYACQNVVETCWKNGDMILCYLLFFFFSLIFLKPPLNSCGRTQYFWVRDCSQELKPLDISYDQILQRSTQNFEIRRRVPIVKKNLPLSLSLSLSLSLPPSLPPSLDRAAYAVGNVSGNRCESACISRGCEFDPGPVPFVEIDHEIISTVILLPSAESFKKGCCQLQAKVCARSTGYLLVQACPGKSVVKWTDRPAMTIAVDLGRKANKQTKQTNSLSLSLSLSFLRPAIKVCKQFGSKDRPTCLITWSGANKHTKSYNLVRLDWN